MFTGLVEEVGRLEEMKRSGAAVRFAIAAGDVRDGLAVDDSIAVNGVCLTVVGLSEGRFRVDAVDETLRKTTMGSLRVGAEVNLERCLRVNDRLGGHIVQGHVDGVGQVTGTVPQDAGRLLKIRLPGEKKRYVISEGSIAIDGVSLTVARVEDDEVTIALIPHTLEKTILGKLRVGDHVNVEVDIIGKYIERMLQSADGRPLTEAWLRQLGFQD